MLKPLPFPTFYEGSETEDHKLEFYLSHKGMLRYNGLKIENGGVSRILDIEDTQDNPNDVVRLDISNAHGSIGARHYYGKLCFPTVRYFNDSRTSHNTLLDGKNILLNVILHCNITRVDLGEYPERFKAYKEGDWFNGFQNEGLIKVRAKNIVERFFPGFRLVIKDDYYVDKREEEWIIEKAGKVLREPVKPRTPKEYSQPKLF